MVQVSLMAQLHSLLQMLEIITSDHYTKKSAMLGSNSIGQHTRHIIEMIQCLLCGYSQGLINYETRSRDVQIETDKFFTITLLQNLLLNLQQPDKALILQQEEPGELINSTYKRELLYNTEHAIHHMALIKVALREMEIDITDENFGVASSTIRYKQSAACVL